VQRISKKVEQTQVQSLRRIIGTKAHSSSSAIEVITGMLPMTLCIRELCCREYVRIMCKNEGHCLKECSTSTREGLRFSPLYYLSIMSKQLSRCLEGCTVSTDANISAAIILHSSKLSQGSVVFSGSFDYHNKTKQKVPEEVHNFIEVNKGKSVMIFTDGSVYGGTVGCVPVQPF